MPQMTVWPMRIAWWIPKATHTRALAHARTQTRMAFPLQQWLRERSSMLRLYIQCLLFRSVVQQHFVVTLRYTVLQRQKSLDRYLIHQHLCMFFVYEGESFIYLFIFVDNILRPPLLSSGQSFWLQIQRCRVRFPAQPDFLSSSGSGTGSTQPCEVN